MLEETTLSEREIEILRLVATGLSNREIAQKLVISPNTVKVHLSNIFEKLGVASRTEATFYAIEQRIVDVPGGESAALPAQPIWRELARKFLWVWVAMFILLALFLVTFSSNVLFPPLSPELLTTADVAERWQELAPLPEPRAGMAAAAYDGDIYAIAGEGPDGVSGSVFRYVTGEDTWEVLSDKPTPVTDVSAALIGEKLYVPGGRMADGTPTDILEIYDPRKDAWEMGAPLPQALSAYALADFEGLMYLFGGWDGEKALDTVWIYDPVADAWREGTPMPTARYDAGAAVAGEKIYVIGGWEGKSNYLVNESYNPQRDLGGEVSWKNDVSLPENLFVFGVQEIADFLFVIGENETEDQIIQHFNTQSENWNTVVDHSPHEIFSRSGITVLGGDLVLLGGRNNNSLIQDSHWHYKAVYTISIPIINR